MNSTDQFKKPLETTQDAFQQGQDTERNEAMNNRIYTYPSYLLQELNKSIQEGSGSFMKMTLLLIALIFPTLLFLSLGYVGRDALKSRIAEKANITVFFKPGVTPDNSAIERLRTSSPWAINNLELIPPASAVDLITKRTDTNTSMLIKDIPPEALPSALIVGVESEHLGEVSELVTLLNVHLKDIQEIRYPAAAIKEALRDLQRIDSVLLQLSIMMILVAVGGCLSVFSITAKSKCVSQNCSLLSVLTAGSLSALLLFITGDLIGTIANWHFSFPAEFYLLATTPVVAVLSLAPIYDDEKTESVDATVHKGDEVGAVPEVQEG